VSVDPITYLEHLSGPIQIHHATGDQSVPVEWSESLHDRLQEAGQTSDLYGYQGDNHNVSANFSTAMQRSVAFFDPHVKGGAGE
jgi:dipeptidyl aminopeptidase/acylaminoacyl peptidase